MSEEQAARTRAGDEHPAEEIRAFTNGCAVVLAERQRDGSWTSTFVSSMGREASARFQDRSALEQWASGKGRVLGYVEMIPRAAEEVASKKHGKSARARKRRALPLSDGHFLYLATEISKWERVNWELYGGPGDPDYDLAFRANFGIDTEDWIAIQRARGYAEPEALVRTDVVERELGAIEATIRSEKEGVER